VHAASNLIEEQLDAFLAQEGHLKVSDRERSEMDGALEGTTLVQWALDQGLFEPAEMEAIIGAHAGALLLSTLGAAQLEITFQAGQPNLKGKPVTDVDLRVVLFEHLKTHPENPRDIRKRLGNIAMHPVRAVKVESQVEALAQAHPIIGEIWKLCDGDLTALQVAGAVSAGQDPALRAIYGMQLLDILDMITAKARTGSRIEDVPVTRNELMMRLERAIDTNHYGVLEVGSEAQEDEIRASYYLLARRYHPDRFRSGELLDLLPRIEAYFSQVTEAYNTLADRALRQSYDAELLSEETRTQDEPEHDSSHLARQNYTAALSLVKRNQLRQAIKFLENAIELEENVPEYHVEFGKLIALNPVRREEAEEHLRRGLELDPTVMQAHVALADLLVKREKPTNAIQVLKEALKWFPDHPDIQQRLKDLGGGESRGLFGR